MTRFKLVAMAATLVVGVLTPVSASEGTDATFETLARAIPGFRLITNTPPVPETRFFDSSKKPLTLKAFDGKALLVNFWATWCTPCVREMPDLNAIQADLGGDNFAVVAIASGQQVGMTPDRFMREHQLEALAVYIDPHASLMRQFETSTLPTTLVIDREGRIRGGVIGAANWNSDAARKLLTYLSEE